mgnify:CR=1 FL=1
MADKHDSADTLPCTAFKCKTGKEISHMKNTEKTMDKLVALCKGRGFIYPGSEIYGGLANTWDYGNLGVELKNNVKKAWWKKFIQESPYNVGIDAAILMNPQTWVASGHIGGFSDPLMDCKACKTRHRADNLIEDFDGTNCAGWSKEQMMDYNAALTYINAFLDYNDFTKMNAQFIKVADITNKPLKHIAGHFPFSFECPSVMSIYHSSPGALDYETYALEECASNYYRITNGHGKGFEALMKAEVLYNRGEIESAEILCHKALYMADGRNQYSIYIAATFIMTLISIYKGANDEFKEHMNNMTHITENTSYLPQHMHKMTDICKSYIYSNLSSPDNMCEWLKDYKQLELSINFHSLGFANIILGKYLILIGDYHKFLGISGQFLGLNHIYSYVISNIYTYIYLSIANNETGEKEKSHKFIMMAVNLAMPDRLYMPFVHNYPYINMLLDEINTAKDISLFVKNIQRLSKPYEKGVKAINKAGRLLADYGLTVREADVAKLAAKRLTNKEIADQLFIAESTVKSNMKMIFNKLEINSRAELKNFFD